MAPMLPSSRPVIAAVDLQPGSRQVLLRARALADEKRLPLLVLHVAYESARSPGFYRRHLGDNVTVPIHAMAEKLLHELVEDVLGATSNGGIAEDVRMLVVDGIPASRIVEVAGREGASSIVMNSCGLQGFARWWRGSVSAYVEKHAGCEVAVLAEQAERMPIGVGKRQAQPLHVSH